MNVEVHAADVHGVNQPAVVRASHHAAAVEDTETDAVVVVVLGLVVLGVDVLVVMLGAVVEAVIVVMGVGLVVVK